MADLDANSAAGVHDEPPMRAFVRIARMVEETVDATFEEHGAAVFALAIKHNLEVRAAILELVQELAQLRSPGEPPAGRLRPIARMIARMIGEAVDDVIVDYERRYVLRDADRRGGRKA